jgi:hypothetical protein
VGELAANPLLRFATSLIVIFFLSRKQLLPRATYLTGHKTVLWNTCGGGSVNMYAVKGAAAF